MAAPEPVRSPTPDFGFNSFAPAGPALGPVGPGFAPVGPGYDDELGYLTGPALAPARAPAAAPPTAPAPAPAPAPVDPAQTRQRATALWRAMDGWGTNEGQVLTTLRGMSAEEVAAVRDEFQNHYGRSLDDMLASELGEGDLAEARAHLTGDSVEGVLAGLDNSVSFWGDDEGKVEEMMRGLSADDRARLVADPRWAGVRDRVRDALGGSDLEVFDALERGDAATASAVRLDDAMGSSSSWYNPLSWGTDEAAVYENLAHLPPEQRAEVEARFDERMAGLGVETTLRGQLQEELSGPELERAQAVLEGNVVDEHVARIAEAMDGWGTDEAGLFTRLEQADLTPEQREQVAARYAEVHGRSLDEALAAELGGTDLERAQAALAGNGAQDPAFMLFYAMEGWGTDEALLRETLAGKSSDEIQRIRDTWNSTYAERYGADFDAAFEAELSGRDHFDLVEVAMRGTPQTDAERAEILELQYSYERGERSTAFGRGYMDMLDTIGFSSSASLMDTQHDRLQALYDESGELAAPEGAVEQLYGWGQDDLQDYRAAKDSATEALATGAEITVAALATLATKGAASPWLVAALAGIAGGAAGMAVREGVQGEAYGREAIAADALKTVLSSALAAGTQTAAVTDRLKELAGVFGDDFAREVAEAAMAGGLSGAGGGAIEGVMDEDALRAGMAEYMAGITTNLAIGGFTGAASGSVTKATELSLAPALDMTTLSGTVATGAISSTAGGLTETALQAGTWQGDAEDVALAFLMSGAKSAASGGLNSAVDYATRARVVTREILVEGKPLDQISEFENLSEAQRADVLDRILRSADPRPSDEVLARLGYTPQMLSDAPSVAPEHAEELADVGIDDDITKEMPIVAAPEHAEELADVGIDDDITKEMPIVAAPEHADAMDALLHQAQVTPATDVASADATTAEGMAQVLIGAGIPQSQLDGLEVGALSAMTEYARAYASGDLEAANAARLALEGTMSAGQLSLVEGAIVAHHFGFEAAQEAGLGPHARAAQVLNDGFEATPAELEAFQSYLGPKYEEYLTQLRNRLGADHEAWSMMSEQELVAVYGYTTNDYAFLNPALRGLDGPALEELMPYIAAAESGLQKLPALGDMAGGPQTTIRGVNSLPPELDAQLQPGMAFSDRAFMSTSTEALENFAGNYQFEIEGTTGRAVEFLSAYEHEKEVLYPTGTTFTIVDRTVDPNTGRTIIRLKESY